MNRNINGHNWSHFVIIYRDCRKISFERIHTVGTLNSHQWSNNLIFILQSSFDIKLSSDFPIQNPNSVIYWCPDVMFTSIFCGVKQGVSWCTSGLSIFLAKNDVAVSKPNPDFLRSDWILCNIQWFDNYFKLTAKF